MDLDFVKTAEREPKGPTEGLDYRTSRDIEGVRCARGVEQSALASHDWSIARAGITIGYSEGYARTRLAQALKEIGLR